jgi:hypothetical protein
MPFLLAVLSTLAFNPAASSHMKAILPPDCQPSLLIILDLLDVCASSLGWHIFTPHLALHHFKVN